MATKKTPKKADDEVRESNPWWIDLVDEDAPKYFEPKYLRKEIARLQVEGRWDFLDAAVAVVSHAIAYLAEAGDVDNGRWCETRAAVAQLIRSVFEFDLSADQINETRGAVNGYMRSLTREDAES